MDTYQIVSRIRCEARDAIEGLTISLIRKVHPQLADDLQQKTIRLRDVNRTKLHPEIQMLLEKYDHSAIAYEFTFDITEKNSAKADLDFLKVFRRGPFNIGVSADKELERQNTRNFVISDTFDELTLRLPDEYCQQTTNQANFIYPITGRIGLSELIKTFLDLNQSGNLSNKGQDKVPTIGDTIAFTTKFGGSVNPSVELSPIGHGWHLAKASFTADASREDLHRVIVGISLPVDPSEKKLARMGLRGRGEKALAGRTSAEERAVDETIKQRQKVFINKFIEETENSE